MYCSLSTTFLHKYFSPRWFSFTAEWTALVQSLPKFMKVVCTWQDLFTWLLNYHRVHPIDIGAVLVPYVQDMSLCTCSRIFSAWKNIEKDGAAEAREPLCAGHATESPSHCSLTDPVACGMAFKPLTKAAHVAWHLRERVRRPLWCQLRTVNRRNP